MRTLLKNVDAVISCDRQDRIYRNTDVWFRDGLIECIGEQAVTPDRTYDCRRMILYPGFVNTHHHLYQYFTRSLERVQGMELFDWLRTLYEIWKNLNEDTVYLSSLAAMGELMRYGCTTCFDHHYVFPKGAGDLIARLMAAADELGIRFVASRGSMDLSKKDGGLPPDSVVQTIDEILADSQRLIERYHHPEKDHMHDIVLAPCSPFSVSGDLMRESAKLARAYGVRLHTLVGETRDEENYTLSRFGMRPVAYMESLGWMGEDVWYAHGIHM
ncbi:MAG: amidohydrolase family protein, partial [Clostridia bacterium]|nr:amidohydrolase family protein [Clostridia bacterium]